MERYEFSQKVCAALSSATGRERAEVDAELRSHIDDHAEALMSAGWGTDEAYAKAGEAMGDPAEVGAELNRQFPRGWLIAYRSLAVLLAVLLIALSPSLLQAFSTAGGSLWARFFPERAGRELIEQYSSYGAETLVDRRLELGNGDVLRVYSVTLAKNAGLPRSLQLYISGDGNSNDSSRLWEVFIAACVYDKNPFSRAASPYAAVRLLPERDVPPMLTSGETQFSRGGCFFAVLVTAAEYGQKSVKLCCSNYGRSASADIPLDWSAVK